MENHRGMAIISNKTAAHWNYFLSVEADLERLSRFIEFDAQNYPCFSVENTRILISAAAEAEVVCKQICLALTPHASAGNMHKYRDTIVSAFPSIPRFEVLMPRYGLLLKPWDNWSTPPGVPDWWTAYNKIKHHRHTEYHRASLKNVLNAVAGLYVVCLYLYKDKARLGELLPSPSILRPNGDRFHSVSVGGYESSIVYNLEDR
jgi:hypothetical protein